RAVFECAEAIAGFPGGTRLHITIYQKHSSGDGHSGELDKETRLDSHTLGRFRLSATTQGAGKWVAQASPTGSAATREAKLANAGGSDSAGPSAKPEGASALPEFTGFGLKADPLTAGQRALLGIPPDKR